MYADPAAIAAYAKKIESSPDIIRQSISEFQPKEVQQSDELKDLSGAMRDAVKLKFLEAPLTPDQICQLGDPTRHPRRLKRFEHGPKISRTGQPVQSCRETRGAKPAVNVFRCA